MALMQKNGWPSWQKHARAELKAVKCAVSALPLAEGLQKLVLDLDKAKRKLLIAAPQKQYGEIGLVERGAEGASSPLGRLVRYLLEVKRGNEIFMDEDALDVVPPDGFLDEIDIGGHQGLSTLDKIGHILSRTESWQEAKTDAVDERLIWNCRMRAAVFKNAKYALVKDKAVVMSPREYRRMHKKMHKRMREIIGISASISAVTAIAGMLTQDEMEGLVELDALGVDKARKYLKRLRNGPAHGTGRTAYLRALYGPVCPKGLAALREQWIREDAAPVPGRQDLPEEQDPPLPEPPMMRDADADAYIIGLGFPGLYRKMMRPTAEELELRRLKNIARRMRRSGMPGEEIHSRLETKSCEKKVGDAAASKPAESRRPKRRQTGPEQALPAKTDANEKPRQDDRMSREEFIGSVRLSETSREAIAGYGLEPKDFIFSLFKGFNIGAGNSAVGSGHFRGVYVRRNIRNYLKREYKGRTGEAPEPEDIIDFLKSVDLVREFGSAATTKTKDDAMSINTSPQHPVGQDIITTINASLVGLRSR